MESGKTRRVNTEFQRGVEERLVKEAAVETTEEKWTHLKESIIESAKESLGYSKGSRTKKPWVTEEMLMKMNERRKWKAVNNEEGRRNYRRLNNELRRTTDKAREDWWRSQCEELELLDKKGRTDIIYAQIKKITEVKTSIKQDKFN